MFVSCCRVSLSLLTSGTPEDQIRLRNTQSFQKMIKTKQPKKIWVDKGTELKGEFEKLCTKREIIKYNTHSEKKYSVCRKKHSIAEKYYLQVLGV